MLFSTNISRKEVYHSDYLDEDVVDFLSGTFAIPYSYNCAVVPIEEGYGARPDLISDKLYGDDMYADILSHLNGPGNPFEMNDNNYIIIPTEDSIGDFVVNPRKEWSEAFLAAQSNRPKPKARTEKRKPNQAIIGDKRFNVDKTSKIVIY